MILTRAAPKCPILGKMGHFGPTQKGDKMLEWEKDIEEVLKANGLSLDMLPEQHTSNQRAKALSRAHFWASSGETQGTFRGNTADYICRQEEIVRLLMKALRKKGGKS